MPHRLFNWAAFLSTAAFCLVLIAGIAASAIDSRNHYLTLWNGCSVTLQNDLRVVIFDSTRYGPYRGSVISMGSSPNPTMTGFGDTAGIYYRMFRWPGGNVLWTLSVSLAYPLVISMVIPVIWITRRKRGAQRGFPVGPVTVRDADPT